MWTTRGMLLAGCLLVLAASAPTSAFAEDEGCAGATLRPHLDRLEGWSVAALRIAPSGGARVVMELDGGGRTLLIAMTVSEAGLNTFQMTRGKTGDSSLDPEVAERLTVMYRKIGDDAEVRACELLKGEPPPPDRVYAELEDLFRSLYDFSKPKAGKGGVSVTLLVVVVAAVLALAGVVLARIRRRGEPALPEPQPMDANAIAPEGPEIPPANREHSQADPPAEEAATTTPGSSTDG